MTDPSKLKLEGDAAIPSAIGENIDPAALRIDVDYTMRAATKTNQGAIRIRRPERQGYSAIRAGEEWHEVYLALKEEASGDIYVVAPALDDALREFTAPTLFSVCTTRGGSLFLWPIRLSREGDPHPYSRSALQIVVEYQGGPWIRVAADRAEGVYKVTTPKNRWPPPEWPDIEPLEVYRRAFEGKVIDSMGHPVVLRLQGAD